MSVRQLELILGDIAKEAYKGRECSSAADGLQADLAGVDTTLQRNLRDKVLLTMDVVVGLCVAGGFAAVIYFTLR